MNEFENLVAEMRKAQKAYFKMRNPEVLQKSKQLEKQVDEHLKNINQTSLFDGLPSV